MSSLPLAHTATATATSTNGLNHILSHYDRNRVLLNEEETHYLRQSQPRRGPGNNKKNAASSKKQQHHCSTRIGKEPTETPDVCQMQQTLQEKENNTTNTNTTTGVEKKSSSTTTSQNKKTHTCSLSTCNPPTSPKDDGLCNNSDREKKNSNSSSATNNPPSLVKEIHIRKPSENDVLCGRGNGVNGHSGNIRFRSIVNSMKKDYVAASKWEKASFPSLVISKLEKLDPPGRFLRFDPRLKLWHEVSSKDRVTKTRQALREGAPKLLEKQNKSRAKIFSPAKETHIPAVRKEDLTKKRKNVKDNEETRKEENEVKKKGKVQRIPEGGNEQGRNTRIGGCSATTILPIKKSKETLFPKNETRSSNLQNQSPPLAPSNQWQFYTSPRHDNNSNLRHASAARNSTTISPIRPGKKKKKSPPTLAANATSTFYCTDSASRSNTNTFNTVGPTVNNSASFPSLSIRGNAYSQTRTNSLQELPTLPYGMTTVQLEPLRNPIAPPCTPATFSSPCYGVLHAADSRALPPRHYPTQVIPCSPPRDDQHTPQQDQLQQEQQQQKQQDRNQQRRQQLQQRQPRQQQHQQLNQRQHKLQEQEQNQQQKRNYFHADVSLASQFVCPQDKYSPPYHTNNSSQEPAHISFSPVDVSGRIHNDDDKMIESPELKNGKRNHECSIANNSRATSTKGQVVCRFDNGAILTFHGSYARKRTASDPPHCCSMVEIIDYTGSLLQQHAEETGSTLVSEVTVAHQQEITRNITGVKNDIELYNASASAPMLPSYLAGAAALHDITKRNFYSGR